MQFEPDELATAILAKYGTIAFNISQQPIIDVTGFGNKCRRFKMGNTHYFINNVKVTLKEWHTVLYYLYSSYDDSDELTGYDFIDPDEVERILDRVQTESLPPALKN